MLPPNRIAYECPYRQSYLSTDQRSNYDPNECAYCGTNNLAIVFTDFYPDLCSNVRPLEYTDLSTDECTNHYAYGDSYIDSHEYAHQSTYFQTYRRANLSAYRRTYS